MAFSHTTGCYAKKIQQLNSFLGRVIELQFNIVLYRKQYGNDVLDPKAGSNIVDSGQQQHEHFFFCLFLACANPLEANKNWVFFLKQLTPFNLRKFLSVAMCKEEPSQSHPFFLISAVIAKSYNFVITALIKKIYIYPSIQRMIDDCF